MPLMEGDSTAVSHGLKGRRIIRRDLNGRTTGPIRRSTKGHWTAEEDETLKKAVKKFNAKNWKEIAKPFEGRTVAQCSHRWQKVLNPELVKGPWTKEEDEDLVRLVAKYGEQKWSTIAEHLPGRIGKQCRERWHNRLHPDIKKEPWTQDEEVMLIIKHKAYGNKWAELTKCLPGRTANAIKNHWNSSLRNRLDAYMESDLLEKFQGLPSVVNESTPTTSSGSDSDELSKFIEQNCSAEPCTDRGQPSSGEFFDLSSLDSGFMQGEDFDYQKHAHVSFLNDENKGVQLQSLSQNGQIGNDKENLNPADVEMAQKEEDISTTVNVQQPHGVLVEHASVENSGIFGETPLKNSLDSPSPWKSPWSPWSPFVPGSPIDTDITLADVEGYVTSPG